MNGSQKNKSVLEALDKELLSGEDLIWSGKPNPLLMVRRDFKSIVFSIIFMFFFLYVTNQMFSFTSNMRTGFGNNTFDIVNLIAIGAGAILLWHILTPVRSYIRANQTIYGLTNHRIIIIEKSPWNHIYSYGAKDFRQLIRRDRGAGRGDIIIHEEKQIYRNSDGNRTTRTIQRGLFGIENVRDVEALILDTFAIVPDFMDKPKNATFDVA